jgi:hypothetical protein
MKWHRRDPLQIELGLAFVVAVIIAVAAIWR